MRPKAELLAASRRLQKRRRVTRFFGSIFLSLLILAGLAYLVSQPAFYISEVKVLGQQTLNRGELKALVEKELEPAWRRQLFFYPKQAIEKSLLAQFPLLKSAAVSLADWQTLRVEVSERQPAALWCAAGGPALVCAVVDDEGVKVAPAPQFSRPVFFTLLNTATSTPVNFPALLTLRQGLLGVIRASEPAAALWQAETLAETDYDLVVSREGGHAWHLLIDLATPPAETIFNLHSALASKNLAAALLAGTIDYVDLRFAPKIFYKLL